MEILEISEEGSPLFPQLVAFLVQEMEGRHLHHQSHKCPFYQVEVDHHHHRSRSLQSVCPLWVVVLSLLC